MNPAPIDEVVDLLRTLRLPHMRAAVPELLATAKAQRWDPAEAVKALLAEELAGRQASSIRARRKAAGFPTGKTFDAWDETRQLDPGADPSGRCAPWSGSTATRSSVVCGPSGTGKTHFCEALGQAAVDAGHKVAWFSLEHLGALVRRHSADDTTAKAIRRIMRADVIVIDDIGLLPVTTDTAEALYRVVGRRLRETLHRALQQPAPRRIRRAHAQDHRQRHSRPAHAPLPPRAHRRRQHPPHPSHRRKGGEATDQLNCGQLRCPPPGSSVGHGWAVPLSATGQIPLAVDKRGAGWAGPWDRGGGPSGAGAVAGVAAGAARR